MGDLAAFVLAGQLIWIGQWYECMLGEIATGIKKFLLDGLILIDLWCGSPLAWVPNLPLVLAPAFQ